MPHASTCWSLQESTTQEVDGQVGHAGDKDTRGVQGDAIGFHCRVSCRTNGENHFHLASKENQRSKFF
jgi:hypothetical protein